MLHDTAASTMSDRNRILDNLIFFCYCCFAILLIECVRFVITWFAAVQSTMSKKSRIVAPRKVESAMLSSVIDVDTMTMVTIAVRWRMPMARSL